MIHDDGCSMAHGVIDGRYRGDHWNDPWTLIKIIQRKCMYPLALETIEKSCMR